MVKLIFKRFKSLLKRYLLYIFKKDSQDVKFVDLLIFFLKRKFNRKKFAIGWLLCGNEKVASSRLQAINTHNYLINNNIDSIIIYKPNKFTRALQLDLFCRWILLNSGFDIIIFQKVDRGVARIMADKYAKKQIRTIYLMADYYETEFINICNHIIVPSDYMKQLLLLKNVNASKISVIEDIVETDPSICKIYRNEHSNSYINVVWVGNFNNWDGTNIIKKALCDDSLKNYKLITISDRKEATIKWDLNTVWRDILKCDIAVIPMNTSSNESLAKSNNRLIMFKALGLPVICSPLPAYKKIIEHGKNGYFAESLEDWIKYLKILGDSKHRHRIGLADRDHIISMYSRDNIGKKYSDLFYRLKKKSHSQLFYNKLEHNILIHQKTPYHLYK